jgi:hypothetical protein
MACFAARQKVLETYAPHDAIICAPGLLNNSYGEDEFIVDRRRLKRVDVLERFPKETLEEQRRRVEAIGEAMAAANGNGAL